MRKQLLLSTIFLVHLPVMVYANPICQNSNSDADGDGWGWENNQTCRVQQNSGNCVDADGDGWGWNGTSSCSANPPAGPTCIDHDGDGWGWTGTESCRVGGEPSLPPISNTRRSSLLNSPWKIGYGRNATGAGYNGQLYVVTNTNDSGAGSLREGLSRSNTWVVYDPSLEGQTIYIRSSLRPAANTTWDGRDALVKIAPHSSVNSMTMIRYYEGNSIMHRVLIGPDRNYSNDQPNQNLITAVLVSEGQDYWFDHVEVFNTDDDAFVGGNNSTRAAINITVTHYKVYSASKGLLVFQDQSPSQNANRVGRVTIAWSDFGAICRNFRVSGGNWVHGFNNYSHDFGSDKCGTIAGHGNDVNRDGTDTPTILAESSVFEDPNAGLYGELAGPASLPGLPVQGYIFTDGQNIFLRGSSQNSFVIDPDDTNTSPVSRPVPPYSYSKMDSSQVRNYVISNAGVNGNNIVYPPPP